MTASSTPSERGFDHLREHSIFFFPLYYQFYELPPPYPFKWGNWYAGIWAAAGVALTVLVVRLSPERLRDVDRVYVEDETIGLAVPTA